jgi:hypothetical protein
MVLFQFYNDYDDIIKPTMSKAREINKVHTAKTLIMNLHPFLHRYTFITMADSLDPACTSAKLFAFFIH